MSVNPLVVSVHALDGGSGEGLVADAQVYSELDCRAACVATSVVGLDPLPLDTLSRQLDATLAAGPIGGVRVGFVGGRDHVAPIVDFIRRAAHDTSVVAVPVRVAAGRPLEQEIYPAARVVVARAVDLKVEDFEGLREAASSLRERGARAAIVAGLSVHGRVVDLLDDDGEVVLLDTGRIQVPRIPGLAGAYAAALTAHLARGSSLKDAAEAAQRYVGFRLVRGR